MPRNGPYADQQNDRVPAGYGAIVGAALWAFGAGVSANYAFPAEELDCGREGLAAAKAFYWLGSIIVAYTIVRALMAGRRHRRNELFRYVLAGIIVVGGLILAHRTIAAGTYCPPGISG